MSVRDDKETVRRTLNLLTSMVNGKEDHSDTSTASLGAAHAALDRLEESANRAAERDQVPDGSFLPAAPGACGGTHPGFPPCFLPANHEGNHAHQDGRCLVGFKRHLTKYLANDPLKGVRWDQCVKLAGHADEHTTKRDTTITRSFR